jgi:hypothetical protein
VTLVTFFITGATFLAKFFQMPENQPNIGSKIVLEALDAID